MYVRRLEDLHVLDAFHPPTTFDPEPEKYKEWHHFVFRDGRSGIFGLINFSTVGSPYTPEHAYGAVIALMVDRAGDWKGNFDLYTSEFCRFSRLSPDLQVGKSSVIYDGGRYTVRVAMPEERIRLNLKFESLSLPVTSEGLRLGSLGRIWSGWVGVPRMRVDGTVRLGGAVSRKISDAIGYHDHNWGRLEWGEQVAWDAGIILDDIQFEREPLTVSFLVNRSGSFNKFRSAAIFVRGRKEVKRAFVDPHVRVREVGHYHGKVRRYPGAELIAHPDARLPIPGHYIIGGAEGSEEATVEFSPTSCCQIITSSVNRGITIWSEMLGEATFRSRLDGKTTQRSADAYMESVRAF